PSGGRERARRRRDSTAGVRSGGDGDCIEASQARAIPPVDDGGVAELRGRRAPASTTTIASKPAPVPFGPPGSSEREAVGGGGEGRPGAARHGLASDSSEVRFPAEPSERRRHAGDYRQSSGYAGSGVPRAAARLPHVTPCHW